MGSWGPGIYSNDVSSEVRDTCQEIFPFVSVEEGNKILFDEYKELLDMNLLDDDYASFWYGLADWQWKHGMLIDEIRDKTLTLLENYTGISEWEADASKATVKKRKATLDKLKEQLLLPQPPFKRPKAKLLKPKHKPGDIVIYKSDDAYSWNWGHCIVYYKDKDGHIIAAQDNPLSGISLSNKYVALLCVGSSFKKHSRYIDNVMDESSVYAVYDYISEKEPDIDNLKNLGFLPAYTYDSEKKLAGLTYRTEITWNIGRTDNFVKKANVVSEYKRFQQLIQAAGFDSNELLMKNTYTYELPNFFITKLYFENIGKKVSTLIDASVVNPDVCTYKEMAHKIRPIMTI